MPQGMQIRGCAYDPKQVEHCGLLISQFIQDGLGADELQRIPSGFGR